MKSVVMFLLAYTNQDIISYIYLIWYPGQDVLHLSL